MNGAYSILIGWNLTSSNVYETLQETCRESNLLGPLAVDRVIALVERTMHLCSVRLTSGCKRNTSCTNFVHDRIALVTVNTNVVFAGESNHSNSLSFCWHPSVATAPLTVRTERFASLTFRRTNY